MKNIIKWGRVHNMELPSVNMPIRTLTRSQKLKRLIDIVGALVGLILVAPLMFLVVVVVFLHLGSPVIFRQKRLGLGGKIIVVHKFRTMTDKRDEHGNLLPDHARTTALGKLLRRLRLDELPQLVDVLFGKLSLVGPRPLLPSPTGELSAEERIRLMFRPGLTGLAQVSGNTLLSLEEKYALDIWYVHNWSLKLDFWICLQTIEVIIRGERRREGRIKEALRYAQCIDRNG